MNDFAEAFGELLLSWGVSPAMVAMVMLLLPVLLQLINALDPWTSKRWPWLAQFFRSAGPHAAGVVRAMKKQPFKLPPKPEVKP